MLPQAESAQEGNLLNATDMPAHTFLAYAGRTSRVIARVAGLLVLAGSLVLVGCEDSVDDLLDDLTTFEIASKPVDSENAELLENLNFTFTDGGVFDAGLDDDETTLVFDTVDGADGTFTLTSGGNTASGTVTFGSCDLTVGSSTFAAAADGPQNGDMIALPTCEYSVVINVIDLQEAAPLRLTVENAAGDSATSGDADVDVAKVCSLNPDELPEEVEDEVCP